MKKQFTKITMAIAVLALIFCQYACSSTKTSVNDAAYYDYPDVEYYYDGEDEVIETAAASEAAKSASGMLDNESWVLTGEEEEPEEPDYRIEPSALGEKLVYTCRMELETLEYSETMQSVRALISRYEGIVASESTTDSARNWYYESYRKTSGTMTSELVIRIPSEHYEEFLSGMQDFGKVIYSTQNVENITRRYSETETTIRSLEIQEDRLLEMMEQADTIDEMLAIEDRLSEVQNELQILKNRLSEMDTDVAYSTVTLTVSEVFEYTNTDPIHTETFADRLAYTLADSWDDFKGFLEGMLFFLIRALPILIVLGVISVGIMLIVMAIVKSSKKRAAKKQEKKAGEE